MAVNRSNQFVQSLASLLSGFDYQTRTAFQVGGHHLILVDADSECAFNGWIACILTLSSQAKRSTGALPRSFGKSPVHGISRRDARQGSDARRNGFDSPVERCFYSSDPRAETRRHPPCATCVPGPCQWQASLLHECSAL